MTHQIIQMIALMRQSPNIATAYHHFMFATSDESHFRALGLDVNSFTRNESKSADKNSKQFISKLF